MTRRTGLLLGFPLLIAAIASAVIWLSESPPGPTGPYGIGELAWGPEVLPPVSPGERDSQAKFRPLIHVWYPSDAVKRGLWSSLEAMLGLAGPRLGVPLAEGSQRFPLVIYLPGWPGTHIENHAMVRELTSHGFIVAGITYPAKLKGMSDAEYRAQVAELEYYIPYASAEVYQHAIVYSTERVRLRARDASLLIDAFFGFDAGRGFDADRGVDAGRGGMLFAHRVNLQQIGIVGFSLGGAAAAEAATLDARIHAAVNIDGREWGTALHNGVSQPFLFVGENSGPPGEAELNSPDPDTRYNAEADEFDYAQLIANMRRNGGIRLAVYNTIHMDFTDAGSVTGLHRLVRPVLHPKRINPRRALVILNSYVLQFMEKNLTARSAPLLSGPSPEFPDVRISIWNR